MEPFSDPAAVANYADGPPRLVPGFASLQRMAMLLLAERSPADASVLVLGAGGGLEIKAFAEVQQGWTFDGVDPSAAMLDLAKLTIEPFATRVRFHHGLIDAAPTGPFDAATCILTLHFVERDERLRTLREVRRRLKPGAPFVAAHFSFSQGPDRDLWLSRFAEFAAASGIEPEQARKSSQGIGEKLPILSPEQDEELLREAGFHGINLFYAAFTFRGWVSYA
jgi:tRNA (cmo5U34)-methyltransferase